MSAPVIGLRELKKQMSRETIADAALQLTLQKGLQDVTLDEIAQVAFVSPRTVSNYFSAKEEAVIAAGTPDWLAVVEAFGEGPTTERPLAALCELVTDFLEPRGQHELELIVQLLTLVDEHPSLRPYQTAEYDKLEEALRERVADRTDTDPGTTMYPWLVAAAAVSAIRSALGLWHRTGAPEGALPGLLETAFSQISDGLPAPRSR
ncbi:TetR family transcriptional regulator [Georgenia sp. 10Sc9-8]|uniref:TetR family transcriptional regulator n=1 Tax=Georgenia halotolerans TaxID=3028317 RepID=A0ABT5TX64_9MICO|nr:TetR family transcriptional regulator [Georgenia halotolerans]